MRAYVCHVLVGSMVSRSDVWTRTLATVGSTNTSDPHGTTVENTWDFSKWTADAVVINLGTNDHLGKSASHRTARRPTTTSGGFGILHTTLLARVHALSISL